MVQVEDIPTKWKTENKTITISSLRKSNISTRTQNTLKGSQLENFLGKLNFKNQKLIYLIRKMSETDRRMQLVLLCFWQMVVF